jgi:hypothetical protein
MRIVIVSGRRIRLVLVLGCWRCVLRGFRRRLGFLWRLSLRVLGSGRLSRSLFFSDVS